ncbi:hypothetical protein Tco_1192729 [Tanacetum coccineum]
MDAYVEEQAELERIQKERDAQEEASRATIYEEWDNEQAMMEAYYKLAAYLQKNEREAISIEEKSRRLAELIRERKKFFAAQRAKAIRNKPPTKTQRRNQMIQYLKNMAGYSHAHFVPIEEDLPLEKVQKEVSSEKKAEGSSRKKSIGRKRAKDKQEQESSKRQRVEDDKEEEELKKCFELAKEEEIAINAIPLATKVPVVGFQIHTRGKPGYYEIFRADGSSKLYHVFSQLLSEFDREDLVNLWKLVKAKHGDNRPEEDFERVLWGDLRVMFKPDVESEVWRSLQGYKRYPLTPITITNTLNKKLQTDQWNEMVYQLLKLMIQKMNIKFRGGLLGLKGFLKLLLLRMDDPNITIEEYIMLEEDKARKRGKVFNWETAKYGRIWHDEDIHDLRSVENKFPAIAFNDSLKSGETLSCEPAVSSLNDEIDFKISFDDSDDEDYTDLMKVISTNIGEEFTNLEILKCWSLETSRLLIVVITEYMENIRKRRAFWSSNEDILKIIVLTTNTPYPKGRYGVSVPALTKDHKGNMINTSYPEKTNMPY